MEERYHNDFLMTHNYKGNSSSKNTSTIQMTTISSLLNKQLEKYKEICKGAPPSVDQIVKSLDTTHLTLHLILIVMAFTTLAIFIEEVFFLRSKLKKNYRRRRMSMLQAGIPPLFTATAVVGTFFPRGNLMIDFVCSVYFGFAMHALLNLMVNYYGGIGAMLVRLGDKKVKLSTPPLCCCCRCIPEITMTRKNFRYLYYATFQAACSRPIVLFFRGVLVLDPTYSINELIFTVLLAASMLTGMWALIILRGVSQKVLKHFHITAKFFVFQSVLLISNIQPFILNIVSIPCVLPYTTRGRIITLNYQVMSGAFGGITMLQDAFSAGDSCEEASMIYNLSHITVVEFFILSLLTRCLYRTKGDAIDLKSLESSQKRKLVRDSTKITMTESNGDHIEELMEVNQKSTTVIIENV